MAYTKVSDAIVPEVFLPYVVERTAELSELVTAGIIDNDPQFATLANQGGNSVDMPFWTDLDGEDQVLDDSTPLVTKKIGASEDFARHNLRGDAWASNDLVKLLTGSDPQMAIGNLVADYWARKMQATTLSILDGVLSIASMTGAVLAVHATVGIPGASNYLNARNFTKAVQKMGDAKGKLTAVIMHSATEANLTTLDLIDYVPDSEGKLSIKVFMGKRVVIDDGMPVETINGANVYTTYLFGKGALALGVSTNDEEPEGGIGTWQLEYGREILQGNSIMVNRRRFILHPRGIKFLNAAVAGKAPTNAELANPANWLRVFEQKNIRIVAVTHNIDES